DFDARASLEQDARSLPFPIRSPEVPEGWTSNSGRVQGFADTTSSHVGWVTGERSYVELVQSDAPLDAFRNLNGGPRPDRSMIPVHGQEWTVFDGDDVRPVWVLDLGDARVAVTGSAATSDFESLAVAAQAAEPLPAHGRAPRAGQPWSGFWAPLTALSMRVRAPSRCSEHRAASSSPRSQSASDESRSCPPASRIRTTSISSSRACS